MTKRHAFSSRSDRIASMPDTTTSARPAQWAMIVAVAVGGAFYLAGQHLAVRNMETATITVSGDAHVSAVPDIAELTFGVQVERAPTAKAAIEGITKNMTAIIDATKKSGVEEKDIATENFWLSPAYDYPDGRQVLRGYSAGQSLRVKVRNLDSVGDVLSAATAAGANQAGDVRFTFDDTDELQAQARNMAIAEAKAKAAVLANDLGVHLGKLKGFNEGYMGAPTAPMMMRAEAGVAMDKADMASLQLPSGEQEITAQVSLTYEVR
jgi:uncharacterized protein YggE